MSTSLRELTIRLAATHPEMRRHLIPLLERGANTFQPAWPSAPPAPVYMQAPSPPAAAAPTYAPAPPYAPTPAAAPAPTYPAPPPYAPGAVPVILQSAPAPAPVIFQSAPAPAPVILMQPPAAAPPPTTPKAAPAPVVDPHHPPGPPHHPGVSRPVSRHPVPAALIRAHTDSHNARSGARCRPPQPPEPAPTVRRFRVCDEPGPKGVRY